MSCPADNHEPLAPLAIDERIWPGTSPPGARLLVPTRNREKASDRPVRLSAHGRACRVLTLPLVDSPPSWDDQLVDGARQNAPVPFGGDPCQNV